jgi:ribonucleotide reductase beta subunit family protein with ferritin-like domain
VRITETKIRSLTERPRAFAALYEHWERHQWSPFDVDLAVDAATFASLDADERNALVWIFAHRFQAEYGVAALLAPFLLAAPDYEMQLLLATQVADEHRHVESLLRVYSEVFGVDGGIAVVKPLADEQLDPVAAALYDTLDGVVRDLEINRDEGSFLRAVLAYHVIGEGSIGRANQQLAGAQLRRFGAFPGMVEMQQLAVRDEVRHIGIGVSYARRCLTRDQEHAAAVIREVVRGFRALGNTLLATVVPSMTADLGAAYGAEPAVVWRHILRQLRVRLRSIGYEEED